MKKFSGYVDSFRRANIMEKMPKSYFFDQEDKPDKISMYIRKRGEPLKGGMEKALLSDDSNNLLQGALAYHKDERDESYQQIAQKGRSISKHKTAFVGNILEGVIKKPINQYDFKGVKYTQPPKRLETSDKDQREKEKSIIRKALAEQQNAYDFANLNRQFLQKFNQFNEQANVGIQKYDSATYPRKLRDIQEFKQMPEVHKTLSYTLEPFSFEMLASDFVKMKIIEDSLVLGDVEHYKNFEVSYMRDLGSINRRPTKNTHALVSHQLIVEPSDMKYHDLMNIASSRLNTETITNCVRSTGITKQQFLNAQKVYDRLKKEQKVYMDAEVQVGEQMIQDEFNIEKDADQDIQTQTTRCISEIAVIKLELAKMAELNVSADQLNSQVEQRLRYFLNILYQKITKEMGVQNPSLQFLKNNVHLIQGTTESGYDRKRLLWFYADSSNLLRFSFKGENIRNLAVKANNNKAIVTTTYKVNRNKAVPAGRKIQSKSLMDAKTGIQNSKHKHQR